jgi:putative endopeptidase
VVHGINRADLDTTCAPCQDFYQFATGGWQKQNPIPAAYPRWGSFGALQEQNRETVRSVLEAAEREAGTSNAPTSPTAKIGLYYATCMDSAAADAAGLAPIRPGLRSIDAITSAADVRRQAALLQTRRSAAVFAIGSQQDPKNSLAQILQVAQGGLGMPDRDYYIKTDTGSAKVRAAYLAHIARTLVLAGEDSATAQGEADRVMDLETALARVSRPRAERRDPYAIYHLMPIAGAQALAPHVDWPQWLTDAGVPAVKSLNVADPDFFRALDTLLAKRPISDWRVYLKWHLLNIASPWLGSRFDAESFRMQQVLTGVTEQLPRWKRCAAAADAGMGEALGEAYVKLKFPPQAKARAMSMVKNMEAVLREDLSTLAWMSPATRQAAIVKLDAFMNKIGYPDKWRDYSALVVERRPFIENALAAAAFEYRRRIDKIGKPVDRGEWTMTPPTVNAYYSAPLNEVVFPAGIMQPPFFDPGADDAVNYGSFGAVIGHEMTHGFDDEGRKYDAQGNLRDWWTAEDGTRYNERATKVVEQFNGYISIDSLHVNGKLTQGENIADLGGLKIAYAALERSLVGKPRTFIRGFSPEQRFFLAWARIWAENTRPAFARQLVLIDPHSPGRWRVNGPLSNLPEFASAFKCQPGDPMVRPADQRAEIW